MSIKSRLAIVGAGTAGLVSAIALARDGHDVTVFEKHAAPSTWGAGLLIQPQGVRALNELGVGAGFAGVSVPVRRLVGTSHRGWKLIDISYEQSEARGVARDVLASVLHEAAMAAGVSIVYGSAISDSLRLVQDQYMLTVDGVATHFPLIVLASGSGTTMASHFARPSFDYPWGALWGVFDVDGWEGMGRLEQRFRSTEKMMGLLPTGMAGGKLRLSMFWSLPAREYASWKNSSLELWKKELLSLWPESAPVVSQIQSHGQLAFASYRQARPRTLAHRNLCVVGDAAHSMSPQHGLGATLAVQDALALAAAVREHGMQAAPAGYSRNRLLIVRAYQLLSRALTPCFQSNGSGLWRDVGFGLGTKIPGMKSLMYRCIAEPGGDRAVNR